MRIELHVHTWPRSQCSQIDPAELVPMAKRLRLDGFCLTEHQHLWHLQEVEEMARDSGIKIFRGNEITTAQGDVLVLGLEEDIQGIITIQELRKKVEAAGGFSILAHPFRGFKLFGIGELEMSVEQAGKKKALQYVDAIEIRNGRVSDQENEMALRVAERLGFPGTAGSDAHSIDELGKWICAFEREINNEQELIEELRARRFTIDSAR